MSEQVGPPQPDYESSQHAELPTTPEVQKASEIRLSEHPGLEDFYDDEHTIAPEDYPLIDAFAGLSGDDIVLNYHNPFFHEEKNVLPKIESWIQLVEQQLAKPHLSDRERDALESRLRLHNAVQAVVEKYNWYPVGRRLTSDLEYILNGENPP